MYKLKHIFLALALSLSVVLSPLAAVASASHNEAEHYQYLLGTDLLCSLEPTACPDIAKASNGDKVEITGQGTLNTKDRTVTGGGTFTHKDQDGNVKGSGTWTAERLISFRSYGSGSAQGLPTEFEGGRAKIKVMLTSSTGLTLEANLKIDCLLGSPPGGAEEGIKLTARRAPNFHEIVSGDTLFIRQP